MKPTTLIHIGGEAHHIQRGLVPASSLYQIASVHPVGAHLLLELPDDRDVPLLPDEFIVISGRERFSIGDGPHPGEDNPCLRKPMTPVFNEIRLEGSSALHRAKLTFDELARLDPDFEAGDGIFVDLGDLPDGQVIAGARLLVQSDDRLYTAPCGNVGFDSRLDADLAKLGDRFGVVDRITDGARDLVIVREQALPGHWSRPSTDILMIAAQGYPMSAMDMFWVPPGLTLADGRLPANADLIEHYAGVAWQRFSWHYPDTSRWNPSRDDLLTHMRFVRTRLAQVR